MALKFKCHICNEDIIVKYLKPREIAMCKKCGAENIVPIDAVEIDVHEATGIHDFPPKNYQRTNEKKENSPGMLLVILVIGMLAFFSVGILSIVKRTDYLVNVYSLASHYGPERVYSFIPLFDLLTYGAFALSITYLYAIILIIKRKYGSKIFTLLLIIFSIAFCALPLVSNDYLHASIGPGNPLYDATMQKMQELGYEMPPLVRFEVGVRRGVIYWYFKRTGIYILEGMLVIALFLVISMNSDSSKVVNHSTIIIPGILSIIFPVISGFPLGMLSLVNSIKIFRLKKFASTKIKLLSITGTILGVIGILLSIFIVFRIIRLMTE